jgi:hypothetical protein
VIVIVLLALPFGGGVTEPGLKAQPTEFGSPVHESATAWEKPFLDNTVQVEVPLDNCAIVACGGLHVTEKLGTGKGTKTPTVVEALVEPLSPRARTA